MSVGVSPTRTSLRMLGAAHREVELARPKAFGSSSCTFADNSSTICHHKKGMVKQAATRLTDNGLKISLITIGAPSCGLPLPLSPGPPPLAPSGRQQGGCVTSLLGADLLITKKSILHRAPVPLRLRPCRVGRPEADHLRAPAAAHHL
jgi:hypothetical protein